MKEREEQAFLFGVLTAAGVIFIIAELPKQLERAAGERRAKRAEAAERQAQLMSLPRRGVGKTSTPENQCVHCDGTGECAECAPAPCRVCRGCGIQPNNPVVLDRIRKLWDRTP